MKRFSLITFLLTVLMSTCGTKAWAYDIAVKNADGIFVFYNFINNGQELEVTYYSEEDRSLTNYIGNMVIPDEVIYDGKSLKVASIGSEAFFDCSKMTSISLPKKLRNIGDRAFSGCSNLSLNSLPNELDSIGDNAFAGVRIKELFIPASVKYIGGGAFSGCDELYRIVVDPANTIYDSRNDCNAIIETVTNTMITGCKNSIIPYGTQTISRAFKGCVGLTSIEIPNTVTRIMGAFSGCTGLTSVKIPQSVKDIYSGAFENCTNLTSIELPNGITRIGSLTFDGCSNLSSIEIPNSVISIGSMAFYKCNGLKTLKIPGSVTSIGEWAFEVCHGLLNVEFENGVKNIGDFMFDHCIHLKSVKIPSSVTNIGRCAFNNCRELSDVYCFAENVPEADNDAFNGVFPIDNNTTLYVPAKSLEKYRNTSPWNKFGTIISLTDEEIRANETPTPPEIKPDNTIEGYYHAKAESYRSGSGGTQIYGRDSDIMIVDNGDGTFYVDDLFGGWYSQRAGYGTRYEMTGTIAVSTDGTVSLIDSHVTGWDDSLLDLTGTYDAANSTFTIDAVYVNGLMFHQIWVKDSQVFKQDGINYRANGDNTVSVYKGKYSGDVVIPDQITYDGFTFTVNSLWKGAFCQCPDLTSVTIPNSVTTIENCFNGCEKLTSVTIPNSVTTINGFSDCGLTSIDIPNSVASLGGFNRCKRLKEIIIPNSVTTIERSSFCENDNLTKLTLSENLTTIDYYSFMTNRSLKSLFIPRSLLTIKDLVFTDCENLESITVEEGNMKFDSRDNCNAIIERYINRLVLGCKTTIIPQDVTRIGHDAFYGCSNLKELDIPNSITSIEDGAFDNCKGLKNFRGGSNLESLGGGAFYGCEALETVIFPQSVNSIGNSIFGGCISLHDVYCFAEVPPSAAAPNWTFIEAPVESATLHVPASTVETYRQTEPWNAFGNIVALNDDDPKPTGILPNMVVSKTYPVDYYSIGGVKSSNPHRGLNIIRTENGTTKKKYVR